MTKRKRTKGETTINKTITHKTQYFITLQLANFVSDQDLILVPSQERQECFINCHCAPNTPLKGIL
jgi:hypothetical protein